MNKTIEHQQNDTKLKRDLTIFTLIIGTVFLLATIIGEYIYYSKPKRMDLSEVELADDNYTYSIDEISDSKTLGEYIYVKGWAIHKGVNFDHFNTQLVLYQNDLKDTLVFELSMQTRTDVTTAFNDGYNYDSSGFSVNIDSSMVGDNEYNIAILYRDTDSNDGTRLILTDKKLICEGK